MGFEPMNTGFADQRVSHFAIGALARHNRSVAETLSNSTLVVPPCEGKASPSCSPERSYRRPHSTQLQ
jgi:hypothetical protein